MNPESARILNMPIQRDQPEMRGPFPIWLFIGVCAGGWLSVIIALRILQWVFGA